MKRLVLGLAVGGIVVIVAGLSVITARFWVGAGAGLLAGILIGAVVAGRWRR